MEEGKRQEDCVSTMRCAACVWHSSIAFIFTKAPSASAIMWLAGALLLLQFVHVQGPRGRKTVNILNSRKNNAAETDGNTIPLWIMNASAAHAGWHLSGASLFSSLMLPALLWSVVLQGLLSWTSQSATFSGAFRSCHNGYWAHRSR